MLMSPPGGHMMSQDEDKISKITKIIIFMKLRPPNLIHFPDKQLDVSNTPFAQDLYDEDLTRGSYGVPRQGQNSQKLLFIDGIPH